MLRSADHNKSKKLSKGQERKKKKKRTGKNTSLLVSSMEINNAGKKSDLEKQRRGFPFLPNFILFE